MHEKEVAKLPRWYFGAVSSCAAATVTHPIDLIKVHLQAQRNDNEKKSVMQIVKHIIQERGCLGFYDGLTSSWLGQITYATGRFTVYEAFKETIDSGPFLTKTLMGALAGIVGGLAGNPPDVVTVRMQNDAKLPPEERRNYRNALDGLVKIIRYEGVLTLLTGATSAVLRGIVMTIGQLTFYHQVKQMLLYAGLEDKAETHALSSAIAGVGATFLAQPVDTMKTRLMIAAPGQYSGLWDCIKATCKEGPLAFYKGIVPSFTRLFINTILIFVIYEQLRLNFGKDAPSVSSSAPPTMASTVSATVSLTEPL